MKNKSLEALHYIKESGYKILDIVESGNITETGTYVRRTLDL